MIKVWRSRTLDSYNIKSLKRQIDDFVPRFDIVSIHNEANTRVQYKMATRAAEDANIFSHSCLVIRGGPSWWS